MLVLLKNNLNNLRVLNDFLRSIAYFYFFKKTNPFS